ncbi:MAG: hypothetical protein HQ475_07110 [SAR202 cluster bacterium]|nr:hypothetical protein [SAR202 cluster bacterium]
MDKAITSALLIIASVVATIALINAVMPALGRSSGALVTANAEASERIKTDIEIVHATGDTAAKTVTVWVKNIGATTIKDITASDIFLDTPSSLSRLSYTSGCVSDCWDYALEGGAADWSKTETVKITLTLSTLSTGVYSVRVSVFNGVSADKDFSI